MDLVSRISSSQSLPPITSPETPSMLNPPSHTSGTSFPVIAVAIIGILATAFLLVSYYIFVIKCCLNWHRIDILRRFTFSRSRNREDHLMVYAPAIEPRGLDESVIRSIPAFKFKKRSESKDLGERSFCECAVCLNEFREDERLRVIPNCSHVFHIDCIDIWLQHNGNCPLCRTSISSHPPFQIDHIIAPTTSSQDPNPYTESLVNADEDYVVIELGNDNHFSTDQTLLAAQERLTSGELSVPSSVTLSPRKFEPRTVQKKPRKLNKVTSMGDECIDIRGKDDHFAVQPIRRSFSMDSSADPQLYSTVQEILQQSRKVSEASPAPAEGCSSNRVRRNFFSFGHGRGSRNAVLPVYLEQ